MNKFMQLMFAVFMIFFAVNAVADVKVGFVNVDRILRESPQAADSAKRLQQEFKQRSEDIDRLRRQINDKENSGVAKEQDLAALRLEYERKQRELNEDASIRKNEELGKLQDRINQAVTAVSEAEGYDLVIYSGLAYTSKRVDLTDKVLKFIGKDNP